MANYQSGGSFLPGGDMNLTGTVNLGGSVTTTGATTVNLSGATTVTLPNATAMTGTVITTPTITFTSQDLIATGATGSAAAAVSSAFPVLVNCNATGVSGAGINLPVPVAGNFAVITNAMTGVLAIYSVGATQNGTTGTTAVNLTATGNRTMLATCTVAGAWNLRGNT